MIAGRVLFDPLIAVVNAFLCAEKVRVVELDVRVRRAVFEARERNSCEEVVYD